MLAAATRLPYRGEPLRPAWAMLSDGGMASISCHRRRRAADPARRQRRQRRRAGRCGECKRRWLKRRPSRCAADARSPSAPISTTSSSTDAGARHERRFTAEEFEPDATKQPPRRQYHTAQRRHHARNANGAGTQQAANGHDADPAASARCRRLSRPRRRGGQHDRAADRSRSGGAAAAAAGLWRQRDRPRTILPGRQGSALHQPLRLAGGRHGQGAQGPLGRAHPRLLHERSIPSGPSTASEPA